MIIERVWAMPNHKTFEIKPIKQLFLEEYCYDCVYGRLSKNEE